MNDNLTTYQQELLGEYRELASAEDRITWLVERTPLHDAISDTEATPEKRVPGCASGLWLEVSYDGSVCFFKARSDSAVIQGIASYLCDLHSKMEASTLLNIDDQLVASLGLERLLSATRRRAIAVLVNFIQTSARKRLENDRRCE